MTGTFAVLVCWIEQANTFRPQKIEPIYLKFRTKLNEFVSKLQKQTEVVKLLNPR